MPEGKTYKVGNDVFDIPDNDVKDFLRDNPKAVEVNSFLIGKDTFDIPLPDVQDFLKENPQAKSLKKKDISASPPAATTRNSAGEGSPSGGTRPNYHDFYSNIISGQKAERGSTYTAPSQVTSPPALVKKTLRPGGMTISKQNTLGEYQSKIKQLKQNADQGQLYHNDITAELNDLSQKAQAGLPVDSNYLQQLNQDAQTVQAKVQADKDQADYLQNHLPISGIQANLGSAQAVVESLGAAAYKIPENIIKLVTTPFLEMAGADPQQIQTAWDVYFNSPVNPWLYTLHKESEKLQGEQKWIQRTLAESQYGKPVDELWNEGNYMQAFSNMGTKVSAMVPYLAAGSLNPALSFGLFYSQAYNDIPQDTKMSEDQKMMNASLNALVMSVGMPIGNKVASMPFRALVEKEGLHEAQNVVAKGLSNSIIEAVKPYVPVGAPVYSFINGWAMNTAANIIAKITDPDAKNLDVFQGSGEAGMTFAALPVIAGAAGRIAHGVNNVKMRGKVEQAQKKLEDISNDINNAQSDVVKKALEDQRVQIVSEMNNLLLTDNEEFEGMSPVQQDMIEKHIRAINDIDNQLSGEQEISPEGKKALEETRKQSETAIKDIYKKNQEIIKKSAGDQGTILKNGLLVRTGESAELPKTSATVLRHGFTEEDKSGQVSGNGDVPINEKGRLQAEQKGQQFKDAGVTDIVTSPIERAKQTAEIAAAISGANLTENNLLAAWDVGELAGMKEEEFDKATKWLMDNPDATEYEGKKLNESFNQWKDRMVEANQVIKSLPKTTGVISHSKNIKMWNALDAAGGQWNDQARQVFESPDTSSEKVEPVKKQKVVISQEDKIRTNKEAQELGFKSGPHAINAVKKYLGKEYGKYDDIPKDELSQTLKLKNNATQERNITQSDQPEHQDRNARGKTAEAGRSNRNVESGKIQEEKEVGISQAANARTRQELGMEEYEREGRETNPELQQRARKLVSEGYDIDKLLQKLKGGAPATALENAVMAEYKASLEAAIEKDPTPELVKKLKDFVAVQDPAATALGKALQSLKLTTTREDNLANFLMDKMDAAGVTELSPDQIREQTDLYRQLKEAQVQYESAIKDLQERLANEQAQKIVRKNKITGKAKKTHEQYAKERKVYVDEAREALKKVRSEMHATVVPYVRELIAIAPSVNKMVKSLSEEGLDKLDDIITAIHNEFKDDIKGIAKSDIRDIISGAYGEKRTRKELAAEVRDMKQEAKLLKQIEEAKEGIKKIKEGKPKTYSNKRLSDLYKQLKEIQARNAELDPVDEKTDEQKLQQKRKSLYERITELQGKIDRGEHLAEAPKRPQLKLDEGTQYLQDQYDALQRKVEMDRQKDRYNQNSSVVKAYDKVMRLVGIKRVVQTAIDFSMPFRQAVRVTLNPLHVKTTAKAFNEMFRNTFSEKSFRRMMFEIKNSEYYDQMLKDGIHFNEMDTLSTDEINEEFQHSFIYDIPYLREPLLASNRAADSYLNIARFELYMRKRADLERFGLTRENSPEAYKEMAKWVMNLTGRGKALEMIERSGKGRKIMNNTFYGTRLMASSFNTLNPMTYLNPKIPKEVKIDRMKDMIGYMSTYVAAALALSAAGATVSLNPDEADFLKVRFGDKRYDLSGGLATYLRVFFRLTKAAFMSGNPNISEQEKIKYGEFAAKSTITFFRNKLAPNTSYAIDFVVRKNAIGQPFDPYQVVKVYPMYIDDIRTAWEQEAATSLLTAGLPSIFGVSVLQYQEKSKTDWDNLTPDERHAKVMELRQKVSDPQFKAEVKEKARQARLSHSK